MTTRAEVAGEDQIVFQGRIIEVVERPVVEGGQKRFYELARRAPGVRLIIPTEDKKGILLTKEYRHEQGDFDFRLPGGKVFDRLDDYNAYLAASKNVLEAATQRARAESQEEAGIIINDMAHFALSHCGATVDWDLYYFVVNDWTQSEQSLEHGEEISVHKFSIAEARAMALDGRMSEERSGLVLLRYIAGLNGEIPS